VAVDALVVIDTEVAVVSVVEFVAVGTFYKVIPHLFFDKVIFFDDVNNSQNFFDLMYSWHFNLL
jgi:hypothetical protein